MKIEAAKLSEEEQIKLWREASEGCCGDGKIVWPKFEDDIVKPEELTSKEEQDKYQTELTNYVDKERSFSQDRSKLAALIRNELTKQVDRFADEVAKDKDKKDKEKGC
ncbi:hypothetical protein [Amygdalobacter nucleatus]|uniref:hypothetical protein n=1 Tax=Amygdalobacter nucleatus TaxID=3029274 RepID=UPI0027A28CB9|nr:hypothetical protein [Amygdalobacter nucleatus]WEG36381.1 hypothetical protein PYS63_04285 [Amygdalobacter nucleatus]